MQSTQDTAEAGHQLPARTPEQLEAEAKLDRASYRRSLRVRIIVSFLIASFIISGIANFALTICSSFWAIPYWNTVPVKSPMEIGLVSVPRLFMLTSSLFCVLMFTVTMLWYKEEPTLDLQDFMPARDYPTVDIFLPRYKEEWDLFGPTIRAALALDYPRERFLVHVLDDGSRVAPLLDQLQPLMAEFPNLRYITRPNGADAKAGNLNNALFQTKGDLLVVLDADHSAKPDFLLRMIPHLLADVQGHRTNYLSDKIAFVQTTQVFYNGDNVLIRMMEGNHQLFYKLMMPSFNGMGCTFCVGTGYVMQRSAIESIGGYVVDCAVEDVVTAVALHKRGWTSKFVECTLTEGLSPETLSEVFTQRERWVAGSGQLLLYRCEMLTAALPLRYRLAYLVGAWYWLVMLIFLFMILLRMIFYVVFRSTVHVQMTSWLPLLAEYVPIYGLFLLLPVVSLEAKVANLIALFTLFPTYVTVFWGYMRGQLNPKHHSFKVKGAAEAFGDSWPMLANLNLGFVACITIVFVVSTVPSLGVYNVPMDWLVPGVFVFWTYFVNIPIFYDIGCRIVTLCRRGRAGVTKPESESSDSSDVMTETKPRSVIIGEYEPKPESITEPDDTTTGRVTEPELESSNTTIEREVTTPELDFTNTSLDFSNSTTTTSAL